MTHLTECYRGGSTKGAPGWRFAFRYDEDAIAALKAAVPSPYREWDEDEKRWWVSDEYVPELRRIFPGFEAYEKQGAFTW